MGRSSAVGYILTAAAFWLIAFQASDAQLTQPAARVSSPEDSVINAIEGFGTDLQCFVNTCPPPGKTVKWYKDNRLITDGQKVVTNNSRWFIRHNVALDHTKDCSGRCSSFETCGTGAYCLDNSCCQCNQEEFTLVIHNLTLTDSGIYQCRLDGGNYMEFEVQVLEGGAFPSFGQNLTFDYSDCCQKNGMSNECRPMCKPKTLETQKFDPIPCQKEFGKLLSCTSQQGNTSHIHCCRLHFVPPFCWDYCAPTNVPFQRANRLCVYWMPEIFQCYEQAYLPLPGYPEQLIVNPSNSTSLYACWQPPKQRPETVKFYSVRYQEVPRFPFFGGSLPFLTGEEGQSGFQEMGAPAIPIDSDDGSTIIRRPNLSPADGHEERRQGSLVFESRRKRQTLVITTHNFATNETEVREYRYKEINTTDTCVTIENLKPSTQYTLYVTASNDFGVSLPSVKATAATSDVAFLNVTLPNTRECCMKRHVDPDCISKMCDVSQPPSAVGAFDIALTCRNEFPQVAPCLADGRDHTECCKAKGVGGECLKMCDGSASLLGVSSVLCLSLDMNSIYGCLREGYVTHPSPPTNVTVTSVTGTSAIVRWSRPKDNGEKVNRYSLFYRSRSDNDYREVQNVTSPYELDELRPDTSYSAYVIAYTPQGKSLKSTTVQFSTGEHSADNLCQFGQPLRDAYGFPVVCGPRVSCPVLFDCVDSGTDDEDLRYCCPTKTVVDSDHLTQPNITGCCLARGVKDKCLELCAYDTTMDDLVRFGRDCIANIKSWVDCGGDGRDDRPCCVREHVPEPCTDFCYPSTTETMRVHAAHIPCIKYVREISKCALEGIYNLPGPARNLRIFGQGSSWVALIWDKPLQDVRVDGYEVYLADGSRVLTFNTSTVSLTIPDLKRDVKYTAHVRSFNSKGASVPAENVTFTLGGEGEPSGTASPPGSSGDLPSAPTNLSILWYRDGNVNLTWAWTRDTLNKRVVQNYAFNISYGESVRDKNRIQWASVTTKNYYFILEKLKANGLYDAFVTAKNSDTQQQGFPSNVISFKAALARASPTAEIQTFPSGPLNVGDKVSISCVAHGDPTPNVTLSTGTRLLASGIGSTSAVINVTLQDSDFFECFADNGDFVPFRTTYSLKIRYLPRVLTYIDPVTVVEGLAARLTCQVRGYPTPDVTWYYQTEDARRQRLVPMQVPVDDQHTVETKGGDRDNLFNGTLTIYRSSKENSGYYYCRACNDLGCVNGSVKLIVDPWPVPQGPDYLLACCKQEGILPECMSACTFDIDMKLYDQNPRCVDEFPKLLACTKDGVDQSACCSSRGVPDVCLSYCNRRLVGDSHTRLSLANCQRYTSPIISCAEESYKVIPSVPVNVRVQVPDSKSLNVSWDASAKKGDSVPIYVVYYKKEGDDRYLTARTENTWVRLPNLETGSEYNVTVIAANSYGFSLFSPLISKRILSEEPSGSHSTAGTVLAVIVCLLLAAVLVLVVIYFTRRPHRLPTFLVKITQPRRREEHQNGSSAVAFENPGYDREGQVHGLPGDKMGSTARDGVNGSTLNGNASGWEHPHLETPQDSPAPQRSGKYTQLT